MFHNVMLVLPYFIGGAVIFGVLFTIACAAAYSMEQEYSGKSYRQSKDGSEPR